MRSKMTWTCFFQRIVEMAKTLHPTILADLKKEVNTSVKGKQIESDQLKLLGESNQSLIPLLSEPDSSSVTKIETDNSIIKKIEVFVTLSLNLINR